MNSIPLQGLDLSFLAYKSWEAEQGTSVDANGSNLDGTSVDISLAYKQASLSDRAHYEELVSKEDSSNSERLQHYMEYLNIEQSLGDPRRAQILYERAIAEYATSADLWLNYTEYLDKTVKTTETAKDIYFRATRNCPWVGDLWVRYLLALERIQSSDKAISAVFEKSCCCTFSSNDELASDCLSAQMNNTPSLMHMYCYWGNLESSLAKDIVAARGVWEKLLESCGYMCEAWQSYIAMEIGAGDIDNARSLYERCYRKGFLGTGSEVSGGIKQLGDNDAIAQCDCFSSLAVELVGRITDLVFSSSRHLNAFMKSSFGNVQYRFYRRIRLSTSCITLVNTTKDGKCALDYITSTSDGLFHYVFCLNFL